ncbi:hypothetical protein [Eleftheria terrae]|uniref:hypothetical protein n=1 Tax=Eleftheria terrae TaxID=1597781 RepID=UPI00263A9DE3|nr:hypothetical protein [Eleftheria terrae]WKB50791.1 hypothetical protein N7L95_13295 [Eleftheria terrae]
MTHTAVNDLQRYILEHAMDHTEGRIESLPPGFPASARDALLQDLFNLGVVTTDGTRWFVAVLAYDVLGRDRPRKPVSDPFAEVDHLQRIAAAQQEPRRGHHTAHQPLSKPSWAMYPA